MEMKLWYQLASSRSSSGLGSVSFPCRGNRIEATDHRAKGIGDPGVNDPRIPFRWVGKFEEPPGVVIGCSGRCDGLDIWPLNPGWRVSTGALVVVLVVGTRVLEGIPHPRHVPFGEEDIVDVGIEDDNLGVCFPGSPQVREFGLYRCDLGFAGEVACLEDEGTGAIGFGPSSCCDHALLGVEGLSHDELAILEDSEGIAEDEVDGSADGAVAVELALGLDVEGVLEGVHLAVEEHRLVCCYSECHRLVLVRPRRVLEPYVLCHEVCTVHPCAHN